MDWTELSNRLAEGAKVYKAFEDGEHAASMLAGFERANVELQAKYDALIAQIEQAKAAIPVAQEEATRAGVQASQEMAQKWATFEAAYTKRVAAAQAELDACHAKVTDQQQVAKKQAEWYQAQISQWEGALKKLQDQVAALEQIKASLKSQLQGVV